MARRRPDERGQRAWHGQIKRPRALVTAHHAPRTVTDELLVSAGRGDLAALASLYDRTAPTIYGLVHAAVADGGAGTGGDVLAAQQVTVQIYLQTWRTAPGFDPERGSAMAVLLARTCRCLADFDPLPPVRPPRSGGQPC